MFRARFRVAEDSIKTMPSCRRAPKTDCGSPKTESGPMELVASPQTGGVEVLLYKHTLHEVHMYVCDPALVAGAAMAMLNAGGASTRRPPCGQVHVPPVHEAQVPADGALMAASIS